MNEKSYGFGIAMTVIAPLVVYISSYLWFTTKVSNPRVSTRICDYQWMTAAYHPLALVEESATGKDVVVATWEDIEVSTE